MGMAFSFAGTGLLIGNPMAGVLLDLKNAVFWKAQVFSAVMMVTGGVFFTGGAVSRPTKWVRFNEGIDRLSPEKKKRRCC